MKLLNTLFRNRTLFIGNISILLVKDPHEALAPLIRYNNTIVRMGKLYLCTFVNISTLRVPLLPTHTTYPKSMHDEVNKDFLFTVNGQSVQTMLDIEKINRYATAARLSFKRVPSPGHNNEYTELLPAGFYNASGQYVGGIEKLMYLHRNQLQADIYHSKMAVRMSDKSVWAFTHKGIFRFAVKDKIIYRHSIPTVVTGDEDYTNVIAWMGEARKMAETLISVHESMAAIRRLNITQAVSTRSYTTYGELGIKR